MDHNGNLWIPVTPEKAVIQATNLETNKNFPEQLGTLNPGAIGTHENSTNENWRELIGIYTDLLQYDIQGNLGLRPNTIPISSSYSLYEPICMEHQSLSIMSVQQDQTLNTSQAIHTGTLLNKSSNTFPVPYRACYNLNSQPKNGILSGASHAANCSGIAPHTPDQGRPFKNNQLPVLHGDGSLNQEKDKQEITSTDGQEVHNHPDQLLQSVEALSSLNSMSLRGKDICESGGHGGIDLNKTPQLKPPKERKYRPKVVVEGKPKRAPKPTPLKTQNTVTPGNRKSERKNGLRDSSQEDNKTKAVQGSNVQSPVKSCRRALNFGKDAEVQEKDQGTTSPMGLNRISTMPSAKEEQQMSYRAETQQRGSIYDVLNSTSQKSAEEFLPIFATAPLTTARDHTLNVIARSINLKNAMENKTKNQLGYSKVHQQIHGEAMSLHTNTAAKLDRTKQLTLQSAPTYSRAKPYEERGHYCNISNLTLSPKVELMHLQSNGKPTNDIGKSGMGNSETHRYNWFKDESYEAAFPQTSCTLTVTPSRQVESRGSNRVHVSRAAYNNGTLQYSSLENNFPRKQTCSASGIANYQYKDPVVVGNNFQEQRYLAKDKLQRDLSDQLFQQNTESHDPSLLNRITDQDMLSLPQEVPIATLANETRAPEASKAAKRQRMGMEPSALAPNKEGVVPKDCKKETGYFPFSGKAAGQNKKQEHAVKIDKIICQPEQMQGSNSRHEALTEKQTALVPYKGDGTIIPYGRHKRRKPHIKVDLDPETIQLWDLLMGNPGSESTETMDKDKEKWWEKEREVTRKQVSDFIDRMHLVQGNRRFSRWKGSVVDSVIGVYLTQCVSDQQSSSAFMSLAAKFPMQRTLNLAKEWEEPEVQIIDPDGTNTYHEQTVRQPLSEPNSGASSESSEQTSDHLITESRIHSVKEKNKAKNKATEEDVFSSKHSSESLILQVNGNAQSSSDSEVEDQVILHSANKNQSSKSTLQTERAATVQHQSHETRSPMLDNRPIPEIQKQPTPVCIRQNSASNIGNNVRDYPVNSNITHSDGSFAQKQTGHMNPSSSPSDTSSSKIPKLRNRKINEKTKSFDWDTLRKQVLLKGGEQKRSKDRLDSLNYEALRHADLHEISEIIKSRGLNNLLAYRIKEFLDRLVTDHGSIDLEWLREIPPDKAKEYLLSFEGLGLKSVECVRLLALHQKAFPVDTNVARIAVRLGWVPLQPLPESLQLHLLQSYPMQDSIQKYLWPRLCKFDQRTLYELHYHMITFGKVFCTMRKPNCNQCPMKDLCRHYASAASTRIALPGPEERSTVSTTAPLTPNGSPAQALLLPPPKTNMVRESQHISTQQEPVIEEPTTPEATTVELEIDIEDILCEDIDEIPIINLSIEELRMNLWEFMKERNVGIPDSALSKSLVALNPSNTSIPTPKLKKANRLHTEHQAYEIPDSHPLLKGIDGRDPEDSNPYLLVIRTSGETANSTKAPEIKCSFQGTGRLCNETCLSCNSVTEANSQSVHGTLLIPCRTATLGHFPLSGTYFQVNEVFADHESSENPINVPIDWLRPLVRRSVYFGSSISTIFKGFSTREIQYGFWKGFVCIRAINRKTGIPEPLSDSLHYSASTKVKNENKNMRQ